MAQPDVCFSLAAVAAGVKIKSEPGTSGIPQLDGASEVMGEGGPGHAGQGAEKRSPRKGDVSPHISVSQLQSVLCFRKVFPARFFLPNVVHQLVCRRCHAELASSSELMIRCKFGANSVQIMFSHCGSIPTDLKWVPCTRLLIVCSIFVIFILCWFPSSDAIQLLAPKFAFVA